MKLLWCEKCKEYKDFGSGTVSINLPLHLKKNGLFEAWDNADDYLEGEWSCNDIRCGECEEIMEIVEVEECPHSWIQGGFGVRGCKWCGKIEEAKQVIWK